MKPRIVFTLLATVGALGLAGCSPRVTTVTGQAFIVTRGADNVKLGDVQILLIPETNVASFIQGKTAEIESEIETKELAITNASRRWSAAVQAYDDATKAYALDSASYETNAEYLKLTAQYTVVSKLEDEFAEEDISLLKQIGDASADGMDTTSLESRQATAEQEWNTETNVVANLEQQMDAFKNSADSQASQMVTAARSNAENAEAEVKKLQAALDDFPTAGDYLNDFSPTASQETKTDSDGKFSFNYPMNGSFTLFATAQRVILNKTETYYWLVNAPTNVAKAQILLSNDNLATVDPDNCFAIKPKDSTGADLTESGQ
jgi:hypothetical protein